MKQKNFTDTAVRDEQVKRINELNEFIEQQDSELTEFDENLARRWLKEIVVWDDRFSVELKSGGGSGNKSLINEIEKLLIVMG